MHTDQARKLLANWRDKLSHISFAFWGTASLNSPASQPFGVNNPGWLSLWPLCRKCHHFQMSGFLRFVRMSHSVNSLTNSSNAKAHAHTFFTFASHFAHKSQTNCRNRSARKIHIYKLHSAGDYCLKLHSKFVPRRKRNSCACENNARTRCDRRQAEILHLRKQICVCVNSRKNREF